MARRTDPVLIVGPSGTGKELAARAVHRESGRHNGSFVARNAATLPDSLIDAELFGNARDYPNPGMADRPGLVGAAHEGTLFLDDIGEMPTALQAHLLRVLDREGTYQRLGEERERRSDFRFVAATNRDPASLKHDLLARLTLRIDVPGLGERPEDIPLLVRHLLQDARTDPELAKRLFEGDHARIAPALMVALLQHPWTTHVRELLGVLWLAIESSPGQALLLTPQVQAQLRREEVDEARRLPSNVGPQELRDALEEAGGSVTEAARILGLSSRYALYRLMKRHDVQ